MAGEPNEMIDYPAAPERPAHSPKGASSAERWMNCSGSSALLAALDLPVTDEPAYRAEGIAMHEAGAQCLSRDCDTWEIVGEEYHGIKITAGMAEAIQMYIDRVRPLIDRKSYAGRQYFIEAELSSPETHELMYGTVDFGALVAAGILTPDDPGFLDVTDLKGGEGIVVEPKENPQMKYYAFMLITERFPELDNDFRVRLTIAQPRAFSFDGPIREWWTTVGEIKAWVVRELLPAMHSTDDDLMAGEWCRFCPAKLVCPLLTSLFRAASNYNPKEVITINSESLGLNYQKVAAVKFYLKALEEEVYRRLNTGMSVPGTKLVNKKANRVFKTIAQMEVEGVKTDVPMEDAIRAMFGDKAYTKPELMTPPQLEGLGADAKAFVSEYAYMPVTGLTVALDTDRRGGVKVPTAQERFSVALEKINAEGE